MCLRRLSAILATQEVPRGRAANLYFAGTAFGNEGDLVRHGLARHLGAERRGTKRSGRSSAATWPDQAAAGLAADAAGTSSFDAAPDIVILRAKAPATSHSTVVPTSATIPSIA